MTRLGRISVLCAAACVYGALAVFPVATPVAQAATCQWNWGLKESFRNYIKGPIANGDWNASGIGFDGQSFNFQPGTPSVDGENITVPFAGTLAFSGHAGALDMTLSDFKIRAHGQSAEIVVDYVSYTSDMKTTQKGERITGDDVAIATIALNQPATATTLDLSGTTALTAAGHDLFLVYPVGTALDPSSGEVSTSGQCGTDGGTTSTESTTTTATATATRSQPLTAITGTFTGHNKAAMGILAETNDTMNALTIFMRNSEAFVDEIDAWQKRISGGKESKQVGGNTAKVGAAPAQTAQTVQSAKTVQSAQPVQSAPDAPAVSLPELRTFNVATGAVVSGAAGTGAEVADAPNQAACQAGATVQQARAYWGVRQSFRSYITGSIAKGSWTMDGVSYGDGHFNFEGNSGAVSGDSGQVVLGGSVSFSGHGGKLDLRIANPEIRFAAKQGQLIADVVSSTMDGERRDFGRIAVADLVFDQLDISSQSVSGHASARLTAAGAHAFADFYTPGTELDPLSFAAALSPAAGCVTVDAQPVTGGGAPAMGGAANPAGAVPDGASANQALANQATGGPVTMGYGNNGGSKFQITKAATDNAAASAGERNADRLTWLALLIAGMIVVGGSLLRPRG